MQVTSIRVMRFRKLPVEQFGGGAGAEIEVFGNVGEDEDWQEVGRDLLADARSLVYENIGMKLPKFAQDTAGKSAKVVNVTNVTNAEEAAPAGEPPVEEKKPKPKKGRGRPKGSKNNPSNTANPAETPPEAEPAASAADPLPEVPATPAKDDPAPVKEAAPAQGEVAADEIPGISTGESRVGPEDKPGDHGAEDPSPAPVAEMSTQQDGVAQSAETTPLDDMDGETLQGAVNQAVIDEKITIPQAKKMMTDFSVKRLRDLPDDKLEAANAMFRRLLAGEDI